MSWTAIQSTVISFIAMIWILWCAPAQFSLAESDSLEQLNESASTNLRQWAQNHGARFDSLVWPTVFPRTGRGVAALKDMDKNETLISIPSSLCISKRTAVGTPIEHFVEPLSEFLGTVVVLLFEKLKGSKSFFAPFIEYLPKEYDMLETWKVAELNEFDDENLYKHTISRQKLLEQEYWDFKTAIKKSRSKAMLFIDRYADLTFELYRWARFTVGTRAFGFSIENTDELTATLIPIADLLNYNEMAGGSWHSLNATIHLTLGQFTKAGEELLISYGKHSHFETISSYGFLSPGNKMNSEPLPFPKDIVLFHEKVQAFSNRPGIQLRVFVEPASVLWFFRLLSANTIAQMAHTRYAYSWNGEMRAVREACLRLIISRLRDKQGTLDDDMKRLAHTEKELAESQKKPDKTLLVHLRSALLYRIDQKRILLRHRCFCKSVFELLKCIPKYSIRRPSYLRQVRDLAGECSK